MHPNDDLFLYIVNDGKLYQRWQNIRQDRITPPRISEYEAHAYVGWNKYQKEIGQLIGVEFSEVAKQLKDHYESGDN